MACLVLAKRVPLRFASLAFHQGFREWHPCEQPLHRVFRPHRVLKEQNPHERPSIGVTEWLLPSSYTSSTCWCLCLTTGIFCLFGNSRFEFRNARCENDSNNKTNDNTRTALHKFKMYDATMTAIKTTMQSKTK